MSDNNCTFLLVLRASAALSSALGFTCPLHNPLSLMAFGCVSRSHTDAILVEQVVNQCLKDPVLGTKIDIETGDVVEWCPSLLGRLLSPILGPEPENAGVNVFKVGRESTAAHFLAEPIPRACTG